MAVGAFALVLVAIAMSAGSAAAAIVRCQPREGYHVVGQGGESVVLVRNRPGEQTVQVCNKASGRWMRPDQDPGIRGNNDFDEETIGVRFRGPYVVYSWDSPEDDCGYSGLRLMNTRARYEIALEFRECGYADDFEPVIVKRSGTVAWTFGRTIYACEGACRTERRAGRSHPARIIARGPTVRPSTLRATPRGITWRQGGRARYARLR
jgi:hypothetical protein